MKITKSITIDLEIWEEAKNHTTNLSKYVNDCLKGLINNKDTESLSREQLEIEVKQSREIIKEASIKESLAIQSLKDLEANKLSKLKESLENEKFKRWSCGACHHVNFMDSLRCDNCNLPTREDKKTLIVNIKGDAE